MANPKGRNIETLILHVFRVRQRQGGKCEADIKAKTRDHALISGSNTVLSGVPGTAEQRERLPTLSFPAGILPGISGILR